MAVARARVARAAPPANKKKPDTASVPLDRSVGYQVRMAHRAFTQRLSALLEPHSVSLGMWYFLRALWSEDGLTQRELAGRVGLEAPATAEQLRNMEARGLIERRRSTDDMRKIHVFLTPEGRRLKQDLLPYAQDVVSAAVDGFSKQEIKVLLSTLLRLQANLASAPNSR